MPGATIERVADADSSSRRRTFFSQDFRWPRPQPIPAYDGQDISWAQTALFGGAEIPQTNLELYEFENASFVIGTGFDGLIITEKNECVEETITFSRAWRPGTAVNGDFKFTIPVENGSREFEDVFLGFDPAWTNYFHWICFALAKSYIADRLLSKSCEIVIPDYASRVTNHGLEMVRQPTFSETVWTESLHVAGLSNRVLRLPPGRYHSKRIFLINSRPKSPTDIANTDLFYRVFSELRSKLRRQDGPRNRIFISRKGAIDKRIMASDSQALETALQNRGFRIVALENMSFIEQAELFYNAQIVVAPHGAGLANVLFGSSDLGVLELNSKIADDISLRPWFYMLSAHRNLRYSYLAKETDGFSPDRVLHAIDRLAPMATAKQAAGSTDAASN